jgi:hypothetical protein
MWIISQRLVPPIISWADIVTSALFHVTSSLVHRVMADYQTLKSMWGQGLGCSIKWHTIYTKFHNSWSNSSHVGCGRHKLHESTFPLKNRTKDNSNKSVYQSVYTHSVLSGWPVFHKAYYIYLHLSYILASKQKQVLESTQCKMIHASAYHLQTEIL